MTAALYDPSAGGQSDAQAAENEAQYAIAPGSPAAGPRARPENKAARSTANKWAEAIGKAYVGYKYGWEAAGRYGDYHRKTSQGQAADKAAAASGRVAVNNSPGVSPLITGTGAAQAAGTGKYTKAIPTLEFQQIKADGGMVRNYRYGGSGGGQSDPGTSDAGGVGTGAAAHGGGTTAGLGPDDSFSGMDTLGQLTDAYANPTLGEQALSTVVGGLNPALGMGIRGIAAVNAVFGGGQTGSPSADTDAGGDNKRITGTAIPPVQAPQLSAPSIAFTEFANKYQQYS